MKHLQLSPPLLLLVMGYPGAGKSFFARQFSEQYGLARISEDRIRYELFAQPTFDEDEYEIIDSVMIYMLEQLMQTESVIVLDASLLHKNDRSTYIDLAKKHKYKTLTVWLQTDAETAAVRAAKRDRRNPDSKFSFDIDQSVFDQLRQKLERPSEKEVSVVISGKHAFKSQCLTVLRKITAIYSDSLNIAAFNKPRPIAERPKLQRPHQKFIQ